MQSELTQAIFGGKNGAPTSVGEVLTGTRFMVGDSPAWKSGEVFSNYFNSPTIQQTIQTDGLLAIFMSHSSSINSGNLPRNMAFRTHTAPAIAAFYNPQNVTVISPNVQPVRDESGARSSYGGAYPVLSSSPGIEVSSNKAFVDAVMEGCK